MKGDINYSYSEFEMIDSHSLQEKKFEKLKEKRYKNRNRESILTYEMMVTEIESNTDGSSWILTKKKSEDDINISNHRLNVFAERKRENKSEEKEKNYIDLKIRKSILNHLNLKVQNIDNVCKNIGDIVQFKDKDNMDVSLIIL